MKNYTDTIAGNRSDTKTASSSKKALKVLFIASGNHGAVSPVVGNQAEALRAEGVEIEWYLLKGKGFKGYLRNVMPLRKYLKEHMYDAIHAHYSLSAFAASLAGATPLVVSLMGSDVKAAGWYKFIIRLFARLFRWKAIIVKSNDMYRDLGIKRAIVIPNGVNMDRFQPMDKEACRKRIGWETECPDSSDIDAAHLDNRKVHILFPANATRPEKDYPLAKAAVERVRELESEGVRELGNERVRELELHAFENTPNEETPYWYNAADVVLMTSKWEGSPNAIKEAMACSRPIVATNVGDIAERMSGVEGCYVAGVGELESERVRELAEAIIKAMAYPVTKGREKIIADGLDVREINQRLIEVYRG